MVPSPPSGSHPTRRERPPAARSASDGVAPTACSIIIRSFNEERHIGRLLAGIMEQTVHDVDIILVDSGSTDATVAIASQFPVTIVHIDPEDFSFGRSLNLGCAAAKKDILVLASAHVYPVYNDWLEQMLAPFADANVGLVYGKQRGDETTQYSEHQIFARWFGEEAVRKQRHPFCNNANAAVRRALWQARPYDEELTGLEDLDWAADVIKQGHYLAYAADAEIIHLHDETPQRIFNRYRREAIAHKTIFPDQSFSGFDFVRLALTNIASDYFHAWHDRVLRRNLASIPVFRLCQFWGTYRGFAKQGPVTNQLKQAFYYPRAFKRSEPVAAARPERRAIDYARVGQRPLVAG